MHRARARRPCHGVAHGVGLSVGVFAVRWLGGRIWRSGYGGVMRALFVAYVLVGYGAWAVYVWGLLVARVRMGKVRVGRGVVAEPAPEVTVIIPAKDEGERLRGCLDS